MNVLRFFFIFALITVSCLNPVDAQRTCASYQHYSSNQNPSILKKRQDLERTTQLTMENRIENRSTTINTIRVAVHVVMANPFSVTNAQIQSQIDVLTNDFRAANGDIGNAPSVFQGLTSDTEFEFVLANVGPNCNGITRTVTNINCFDHDSNDMKSTSSGGHDPIDPEHILNIWVAPICNGVIGFATFPGEPFETDGVVIDPSAFGLGGTSMAPFNLGRTATHEVGHYFNLFHIWGDDSNPGDGIDDCSGTDLCGDTPNQERQNFGCPSFPHVTCSNGPSGDMFMNYMDYVNDNCMIMFTPNQSTRMKVALFNARPELLETSFEEVCCSIRNLKPNLSTNEVTSQCNNGDIDLKQYLLGQIPAGSILVWSTDNNSSDGVSPVISGPVSSSGTYYGYFMNIEGNCFSNPSNAIVITISPVCSLSDMIVTQNSLLQSNSIFRSITIKPNATLTINGAIVQIVDKVIIEFGGKLIIDGATLTNCSSCLNWKGIQAWGNPFVGQSHAVELKNGAIIENAEIGINTSNPVYGGIFGYFDLSGAKVTLDNSTIRNCGIGVNFGPFGYSGPWFSWEDDSHFINSTIDNCDVGVKLKSNLGVDFQNTNFTGNNTGYGIESINSKINVSDCDFEGVTGINFSATWPSLIGSEISNNNFLNDYEGILWDAQGNATEHSITGNFFGSSTGVLGYGQSFFNIQSNDFAGGSGVFSWYSGDDYNLVSDNGFNGNDYGASAWGKNNVEYLANCFDNIGTVNIEMYDNASIFDPQGDQELAASNCFSKQVPTFLNGAGSEYFTYFIKSGTVPQSCKHPGFGGNFGLDYSPDEVSLLTCGTGVWGPLPPRYRNCVIPATLQERKQMEQALKAEIARLKNDTTISPLLKKWLIARYERCLKKLIGLIALEIVKTDGDGREHAITYLSNQELFSHKIMAYSLIAESGDYTRAENYLTTLPTSSTGESDFVAAQYLFLDFITQGKVFVLTNQQKSSLEDIARAENEWSGFARTIYYLITGQRIKIDLPHLIPANPRNTVESNSDKSTAIEAYPNPVSDNEQHIVNIQAENGINQYQIRLFDIMGKEVLSKKATVGENALDMNTLNKGVFILEVFSDDKQIYSNKLIKL